MLCSRYRGSKPEDCCDSVLSVLAQWASLFLLSVPVCKSTQDLARWVVKVVGRDSNCGQSGENLQLIKSIGSLSWRCSQFFINPIFILEEKGCISPAVSCEYASLPPRQPLTKSLRLHSGEMRCEAKSEQKSLKYGISSSAFLLLHALWCSLGQWGSPWI